MNTPTPRTRCWTRRHPLTTLFWDTVAVLLLVATVTVAILVLCAALWVMT